MIITVAGRRLNIHDREEWQLPSRPVTGPRPYPELVHHAVIHWPGASANWKPPSDVAAHLRWSHDLYLINKGFSYGYGFVCGPNPVNWNADPIMTDIWEVRGTDIRLASNDGDNGVYGQYSNPNFNGRSNSLQIMSSENYPATSDQIKQAQYWVAWMDQVYNETVAVIPHRVSDATACPGDFLTSKIPQIATRPSSTTPPPQPPPSSTTYTVVSGDTWWGISRRFGMTVDQLVALNPPATSSTVLHPGDVLNVTGPPPTNWVEEGAKASTPPGSPVLREGVTHNNVMWLQSVLCSMPKLQSDGGGSIYNPQWVGYDTSDGNHDTESNQYFGDATRSALAYWQSKNGLPADGVYGSSTANKMFQVRGK